MLRLCWFPGGGTSWSQCPKAMLSGVTDGEEVGQLPLRGPWGWCALRGCIVEMSRAEGEGLPVCRGRCPRLKGKVGVAVDNNA